MTVENEESTNVDQTPANAEGVESQNSEVGLESLVNERLLTESKKYKARARDAEKRLKEIEQQKLESQGKYKEMYESVNTQYSELKNNLYHERKNNAVQTIAGQYGCVDYDALMKLGNHELLVYDEEVNRVDGVESFIDEARRKYPYLFQKKTPPAINSSVPAASAQDFEPRTMNAADIAKMSSTERVALMMNMEKKRKG